MTAAKRPVILAMLGPYWPVADANGPVRSMHELIGALSSEFEFRILGRDRPYEAKHASSAAQTGRWLAHQGGYVRYEAPEVVNLAFMTNLLRTTPHDILYINSCFEREFGVMPLLARSILRGRTATILAPRGELADGALRIKQVKKLAYLAFAKLVRLHSDVAFQATSDLEREQIFERFPSNTIFVCPNISPIPVAPMRTEFREGELRVVYLSRIARKKNLDFALRVLSAVSIPVIFDIYGPISEDDYWQKCWPLIASLPPNITACYRGEVPNSEVSATLAHYDLLLLPTAGENFGHAIVEALASGLPVLISDRTPWRGLEAARAGFDLPLDDPQLFARALILFHGFDRTQRSDFSAGAIRYVQNAVNAGQAANAHRMMFNAMLGVA